MMPLPKRTDQQSGCCTILRTFVITPHTLDMASGEMKPSGEPETVTGPCNTPLFGRDSGICKGCQSGWEVPGNKFANEAERERALASPENPGSTYGKPKK